MSHQWYYSANTALADAANAMLTLTNLQTTNAVQAAAGDANGGYTTNFTDISGLIIISGSGDATTNYVEIGGATNVPARYYRVRVVP